VSERNIDPGTVAGFGDEWQRFRHDDESPNVEHHFAEYFSEFPWDQLPANAEGADFGCGSGRWARLVAPRVGTLHLVDASAEALAVARHNLRDAPGARFHRATIDDHPIPPESLDFGYCLGVLHHIPDTRSALAACVRALKPGAPFLLYLYYALENRPAWYRALFHASTLARYAISKLPPVAKNGVTDAIAVGVYLPLARAASVVDKLGGPADSLPLAYYRSSQLYTMRNDARDRFGTPLEQRFTRAQIQEMLESVGMKNVRFREGAPYWCAVSQKA